MPGLATWDYSLWSAGGPCVCFLARARLPFHCTPATCYNKGMSDQIFFSNLNELRQGLAAKDNDEVSLEYFRRQEPTQDNWFIEDFEGQLNVDVMETEADIIIAATVAGTDPKNLQIFLNYHLLTIRCN